MGSIKGLQAATGCTQLITIHQPSPGVFDLFDGLIMLKQGSMRAARRPPPRASLSPAASPRSVTQHPHRSVSLNLNER